VPPSISFSGNFVNQFAASSSTCTAWTTFLDTLSLSSTYQAFRLDGSFGSWTCEDSVAASALCQALNTRRVFSTSCNGRTVYANGGIYANGRLSGTSIELDYSWSCHSGAGSYAARPCIALVEAGSANWGGFNSDTCSGPTQTMNVSCVVR
jgi:hypothetical protein